MLKDFYIFIFWLLVVADIGLVIYLVRKIESMSNIVDFSLDRKVNLDYSIKKKKKFPSVICIESKNPL